MAEEENENENEEQEDAESGEEGSEAKEKKPLNLPLVISVAALVIVLLGGAAAAYFISRDEKEVVLNPDAVQQLEVKEIYLTEEGQGDDFDLEEDEEALGALFPLETFVVNLTNAGFLRIQIQVEFKTKIVPKRFYTKLVPIRDALIGLLSVKQRDSLVNSNGKDELKVEIQEIINATVGKEVVKNIYFTQFVIQ